MSVTFPRTLGKRSEIVELGIEPLISQGVLEGGGSPHTLGIVDDDDNKINNLVLAQMQWGKAGKVPKGTLWGFHIWEEAAALETLRWGVNAPQLSRGHGGPGNQHLHKAPPEVPMLPHQPLVTLPDCIFIPSILKGKDKDAATCHMKRHCHDYSSTMASWGVELGGKDPRVCPGSQPVFPFGDTPCDPLRLRGP